MMISNIYSCCLDYRLFLYILSLAYLSQVKPYYNVRSKKRKDLSWYRFILSLRQNRCIFVIWQFIKNLYPLKWAFEIWMDIFVLNSFMCHLLLLYLCISESNHVCLFVTFLRLQPILMKFDKEVVCKKRTSIEYTSHRNLEKNMLVHLFLQTRISIWVKSSRIC